MDSIKDIRQTLIKMIHRANVSHIGSALSVVDILYVLYFRIANISQNNLKDSNRDIIILSKAHASVALYAVLYHKGYLTKEMIKNYALDNGSLPCHIDKDKSPFFEVSTGSLGHGSSLGVGFALAKKMDNKLGRVFVVCGDGECNEGSIWESLMFASTHNLNNFIFIVDFNKLQGFGRTNEVINQQNIAKRIATFGFETHIVDGHNIEQLTSILSKNSNKPMAIIANTTKGKGVSFMEDKLEWHYKSPNEEQLKIALLDIESNY